jgi:GT2 family glycosyltransferase
MGIIKSDFTILITTKNRFEDLVVTLKSIEGLLRNQQVECRIFDDGSTDGTFDFIKKKYPTILLQRNEVSKGYLYCRNVLLNQTTTKYAISLDDDAHFVTENPLESLQHYFDQNPNCGVIAARIFWGLDLPNYNVSKESTMPVQSFVGCAHVWRMKAWHDIPNYPEWFIFYGEEDFASYQLFKQNWSVHYLPKVLVQHRVDVKSRKKNSDYTIRLRRSLRSGWYLLFLFTPLQFTPRKLAYSICMQVKLKVFKGDFKALQALVGALIDLIVHVPKLIKFRKGLTVEEWKTYQELEKSKIYWQPQNEKTHEKL